MIAPLVLCLAGGLWALGLFALGRRRALSLGWIAMLIASGLVFRGLAFGLEPYLEIDFYRYFWDGRQVLFGFNPYAQALPSPLLSDPDFFAFAQRSENLAIWQNVRGDTHALSTIYAPLSIGLFTVLDLMPGAQRWAYGASFLLAEGVTLALLIWHLPRSQWALAAFALALNPLLILVTYNGLHFDIWLLPLLTAWALLLRDKRAGLALAVLLLAIALRHWPVLLLPITLMHLPTWRQRFCLAAVSSLLILAALWPQLAHYTAYHSGLRVYGKEWAMNSALFTWAELALGGSLARLVALGIPCLLALTLPFSRLGERPIDLAVIVVSSLLLLSPTFVPWYWLWLLPFLLLSARWYRWPLLALSATLPLYYLRFELEARGLANLFDKWLVWIEFGPILLILLIGARLYDRRAHHSCP